MSGDIRVHWKISEYIRPSWLARRLTEANPDIQGFTHRYLPIPGRQEKA